MSHAELQRDAYDCATALAWKMRGRAGVLSFRLPSTGRQVLAGWNVATSHPGQLALFTCSYDGVDMRWRPRLLSRARFDAAAAEFVARHGEIAREVERRIATLGVPRRGGSLGL